MQRRTSFLSQAIVAIIVVGSAPTFAQEQSASIPVVQPQGGVQVERLNSALQRLARNPQSVDALIDAGTAALDLGDIDAAIGFFGRADELSPGYPRAKLGMAAGFMRSDRPIEALRLFAEAESAGVSTDLLASDRGLAFDLVGDNDHAQEQYRRALSRRSDNDTARRLAISLAISGKREDFEKTLLPMLKKRDLAAYRARAFGLAILGDSVEAKRIAAAVMPQSMAQQIGPYLDYMPRLTKMQQAAAANFGRFPQASEIGRDDPAVARFARADNPAVKQADARLAPQGAPLGQSASSQTPPAPPQPVLPQTEPNLARVVAQQSPSQKPPVHIQTAPPSAAPIATVETRQDINDAFSGFTLPVANGQQSKAQAVDITTIKPRREVAAPPPPAHPSRIWVQVATGQDLNALKFDWRRLSRKAPDLLGKFKPHTTPWGQANRLLAGPYPNDTAAREVVNALKAQGIDTFSFTSPQGQEVRELN